MFCREKQLPHPGFIVLDSPLLSYREPLTSRYGPLSADEEEITKSDLKEQFYRYLAGMPKCTVRRDRNDEPPVDLSPDARITPFAGPHGVGDRKGFF